MAVAKLADELLHMILAPSLTISRQHLVSSSLTVFGSNDAVSSASVLLVCKRWLRVATPILYETVIIRSTGQARALANAFRHNPSFAEYVKNLRLEGAFAFLEVVLSSCTNLVTFVLLLDIYSDANVTKLCRSFPLMDPTEVILRDQFPKANMKVREVFLAFCNAIPEWKNLTSFEFSCGGSLGSEQFEPGHMTTRLDRVMDSLARSKSLREIYSDIRHFTDSRWRKLAKISSVDFKFYYHSNTPFGSRRIQRHLDEIRQDAQLSKYSIDFIDISENFPPRKRQKQSIQTACGLPFKYSFEAIDDNIWKTIITFAAVPDYPTLPRSSHINGVEFNKTRQAISLACKKFERLVRPLLFEFPLICSIAALHQFTEQVLKTPSLGHEVRVMSFNCLLGLHGLLAAQLCTLIPHLTHLLHLHNTTRGYGNSLMTSELFSLLAKASGDTLLTLTGDNCLRGPTSFALFNSFKRLQTLEIGHSTHDKDSNLLEPDALPSLHTLDINTIGPLFNSFCTLRLPCLRSLSLNEASAETVEKFLKSAERPITHLRITGFAVITQVLKLTPTILHLEWEPRGYSRDSVTVNEAFSQATSHEQLQQMTLLGLFQGYGEKEQNNVINAIFSSLDFQNFPSLEKINFPNYWWPIETYICSVQSLSRTSPHLQTRDLQATSSEEGSSGKARVWNRHYGQEWEVVEA